LNTAVDYKLSARAKHPLFGAELRARRASVHIGSLRRHLQRWADAHGNEVKLQVNEAGEIDAERSSLPDVEMLGRSGVWIGEAVYNLRSSLDYLVYNIACICNGGRHVAQTQFPICDDPIDFWAQATGKHPTSGKKVTCRLAHVPPNVIDRFTQLQPWSTPPCEWTAKLRDLSNPDKHRAMANLRSVTKLLPGDHPDVAELLPDVDPNPEDAYFVVQVLFADTGDDVVDTLVLLQREVLALIKEFKPAFGV
jgi:hypothetical protein